MIEKTLVLSTKEFDDQLRLSAPVDLDDEKEPDRMPFRYITRHQYGYIIFISPSSLKELFDQTPILIPVLKLAKKRGCTMINFDRDADTIPGIPVYEW